MTEKTAQFLSGELNKFRNVIDKVRNDNLSNETAWISAKSLFRALEKIDPLLKGQFNHPISRELFNAARSCFLAPDPQRALEEYRRTKRATLSPLPDEEFAGIDQVAHLYEDELFSLKRSKASRI